MFNLKIEHMVKLFSLAACLLWSLVFHAPSTTTAAVFPLKPEKGFVLDETLRFKDAPMFRSINRHSRRLSAEQDILIYTLIIKSIYDKDTSLIDHYADDLFDEWDMDEDGMLLVIDCENENAHIALGPEWDSSDRETATVIVETLVVPCLADGNVVEGIQYGLKGLEALAAGDALPEPYRWWKTPFFLKGVLPICLAGMFLNLIFRYRNSWFWVMIPYMGAFFFVIEWVMRNGGLGGGGSGGFGCGGCAGCGGCGGCSG